MASAIALKGAVFLKISFVCKWLIFLQSWMFFQSPIFQNSAVFRNAKVRPLKNLLCGAEQKEVRDLSVQIWNSQTT